MPDWWQAQRDVVAILMDQEHDLPKLVATVSAAKPETGQEAMVRLSVFMRAGMTKEAIEMVVELQGLCPDLANHQIGSVYYEACDHFSAWEVAQRVVEVFADNISGIALENRLLKHLQTLGWSIEQVDQWLMTMPLGGDGFWVKERLRFNTVHGRSERLIRELTNRVRGNPEDIDGAIMFLDALVYARHTETEEWDLSWMTEAIRPQLATEAEQIASRLKTLSNWMTATTFYRQAIDAPLTDEEVGHLAVMHQAFISPEQLRAAFAVHAREGMAECLLKMGREDRAQKWMVEAADIRERHNLGLNVLFAGQVQAASGQRVIESRIKEEEWKSDHDPEYWRKRAQYYWGRNEPRQEEQALRRGLALTTPRPEPERQSKGHMDWRGWLLADYARFLARMNRPAEAVALLRQELEQAPATSESTMRAARLLAFDFAKHLSEDDEVLWTWLANRPKWEHTEERLLWRMLERVQRGDLDKYFLRAEELANGRDPSRAYTLGWIMNRMQFPERSIPLLEYAGETAPDDQLKERARLALFESCLDMGDWKRAEQLFPEASKRLTPREVPEWHSRIAVVAAAVGKKVDAIRIWKAVANVNPSELAALDDLVKYGLRGELIAFYNEMAKKMPSSEIPAKVLRRLEKR
jgi:tetratricopeptide (TPR) repeat protein